MGLFLFLAEFLVTAAAGLAEGGKSVLDFVPIRADALVLPGCEAVEVHSREHHREEFAELAAEADHTLVIAPEIDNVLLQTNTMAREAGGRLPDSGSVSLGSNPSPAAKRGAFV